MFTFYFHVLYVLLIVAIVAIFFVGFSLGAMIYTRGVPFVPLSKLQRDNLKKYIKLDPNSMVVDLGCGDGRVMRLFEQMGVKKIEGYEVNLLAYLLAIIINKLKGSKTIIYYKNFFKVNLSKYNVVFVYLMPNVLMRLRDKFDHELKPGTKIISASFEIAEWRKPKEIIVTMKDKPNNSRIFIYEI